ncbi:hypothetical protein MNBD_NITROSPINAE05-567 [hydrothermal vent metagenome]|uniref:DUF4124 domain-containing protein n=1 Tax=hydrothermal vent metagenome TaxID=652676 RepID=A0A3B1DDA6_9ZZZZ
MVKIVFSILIVLLMPLDTYAHSGGTNAQGCHKNRKTGDYHCHNKKRISPKNKNPAPAQNKKISTPQTNKRIHHWIDETGAIHYSDNLKDVPVSEKKSMPLK